jgi:small basic protein (TIGR04137 family)
MSQHPSFHQQGSGGFNKRSVLKRFERIDLLRKRGQWDDARTRITGLPKTLPEA